ncbi:MAG: sugar nucleotide-binding protein [[Actinobacillus] rossii]|nr:sugar nucleotide-binding protein [[Actinobacillus] rossii]MDY5792907.1 sugar nucleotide-binding protein [[Actinobacillus] rossii]
MKVLILGSSGFIGRNLSQLLPNSDGISLRNENWKSKVADSDVIINLVGKAHDHKKIATEKDFYFVNVQLIKDIFKEFVSSEARLLIHISSIAALEEFNSERPLLESDSCNPSSFYGKTKREAEKWLLLQPIPDGKRVIILRPPMVHGTGDKGNLRLLYRLLSNGIPYPLSAFKNQRSFICIDNFTYFIQKIIETNKLETGIYHISDDETVSTNQIVDIIKKLENKKGLDFNFPQCLIKLIATLGDFLPIPLNNVRLAKMTGNLVVSNNKIKTELGIVKLPLTAEAGLIKTIRGFKSDKNI